MWEVHLSIPVTPQKGEALQPWDQVHPRGEVLEDGMDTSPRAQIP